MSSRAANDPAVFQRLAGVETEYLFRVRPRDHSWLNGGNESIFLQTLNRLKSRIAVVPAIQKLKHWFLGNGGGLRFECVPLTSVLPRSGFMEGATPECRGPAQLLQYQRAQDLLLSQACVTTGIHGETALVKCSHDSHGHVFGAHENYEVTIASGLTLICWKLIIQFLVLIFFLMQIAGEIAVVHLVGVLVVPWCLISFCCGQSVSEAFANLVMTSFCLVRTPIQWLGNFVFHYLAFRQVREQLTAFLVTRTIYTGSGRLDSDGQFWLSSRASSIHATIGICSSAGRSMYYFCHLLKAVVFSLAGERYSLQQLSRQRQRLQLAIGDANMAQTAEYLKFGTTMLVLDVIESGGLQTSPELKDPLNSLKQLSCDLSLSAELLLKQGTAVTAITIQRFYWNACRRFLDHRKETHLEAERVMSMWKDTLDALESDRDSLVGKVDWITKLYLFRCAGQNATLEEQRKIDLRYHELTTEGYYALLEMADLAPTIVDPEDVLAAASQPPANSPATLRGRLIQRYASQDRVSASWYAVRVTGRWFGRSKEFKLS